MKVLFTFGVTVVALTVDQSSKAPYAAGASRPSTGGRPGRPRSSAARARKPPAPPLTAQDSNTVVALVEGNVEGGWPRHF